MDLDYTIYGVAEKHLGWFNMRIQLEANTPLSFNHFAVEYMEQVRKLMNDDDAEIAHLKLFAANGDDYAKVSLTDNGTDIEFNHRMTDNWSSYDIYINARINHHPDSIRDALLNQLNQMSTEYNFTYETRHIEHFKPGDPDPQSRSLNMAV